MKNVYFKPGAIFCCWIAFIFFAISGSRAQSSTTLIFQSGFEDNVYIIDQTDRDCDIVGKDTSLSSKNDWESDLEGHPMIGNVKIHYQGGDTSERIARIIDDPVQPENKVLQFWMNKGNAPTPSGGKKSRIQTNFYNNNNLHEFSFETRVFFSEEWSWLRDRNEPMGWFLCSEYWNNANWTGENNAFRVNIHIEKIDGNKGNKLCFQMNSQNMENKDKVWVKDNHSFDIPIGEWFTMNLWIREGDSNSGRVVLAVTKSNGEKITVFDIHETTQHPNDKNPDGFSHFNPLKAYGDDSNLNYVRSQGGVLEVLWDDFKFWAGKYIPIVDSLPVDVNGVTLSPNSLNLEAGQASTLIATVSPSNATDKSITWSSSDTSVVSVGASGTVSAIAPGTATVTVITNNGNYSATSSITVFADADPTGVIIAPYEITASDDDGNIAANTVDGDLETRWSADGNGKWIMYDLGINYIVEDVGIAFFKGDQRSANFEVEISTDGQTWTNVFTGNSSGEGLDIENFNINDSEARYVKIVGNGNSENNWNSFTEVVIYGTAIQVSTYTNSLREGAATVAVGFQLSPAKDAITLDNVADVIIINANGKVVLTSSGKKSIDISALVQGIYFLKIGNNVEKLIVQ